MKYLGRSFAAAVVAAFLCLPAGARANEPVVEATASIHGRVLDPAGKPVAGALVVELLAAERGDEPVTTDAAGNFTLGLLVPGEVVLLAASGKAFTRDKVQTGEPVEIRLEAPKPVTERQLDALSMGFWGKDITPLLPYRKWVGDDRLVEMALRLDAARAGIGQPDDTVADENVGAVLVNAVEKDAAGAATWSVQQLERFPALRTRPAVALPIWEAVAAQGDGAARDALRQALQAGQIPRPGAARSVESVGQWFALASLAALLGDEKASQYMDRGLADADFLGQQTLLQKADNWGRELGAGGLELLGRLDEEWPVVARLNACTAAAEPLSRFHPEEIPALLNKVAPLLGDPAVREHDADLKAKQLLWGTSSWRMTRARMACAQGLAAKDLDAALEQAPQVAEVWMSSPTCKRIVDVAVAQGNHEAVLRAIKICSPGERELRAYFAARVRSWDERLSSEMFAEIQSEARRSPGGYYIPVEPSCAFYLAPYEPARSRLTLEGEWARRERLGRSDEGMNPEVLPRLAVGMVALDPARALEWFNATPDRRRAKDGPRAQMLAYLLALSPARDIMPLTYAGE
jgi:hypothetical protein